MNTFNFHSANVTAILKGATLVLVRCGHWLNKSLFSFGSEMLHHPFSRSQWLHSFQKSFSSEQLVIDEKSKRITFNWIDDHTWRGQLNKGAARRHFFHHMPLWKNANKHISQLMLFYQLFLFPFHSFAKKEELQKENMNICQIVNHEMSAREGMNRSAKRISFSRKRHIPYIMASATLFVKIDQCYYNPHFRILLRNVQTWRL